MKFKLLQNITVFNNTITSLTPSFFLHYAFLLKHTVVVLKWLAITGTIGNYIPRNLSGMSSWTTSCFKEATAKVCTFAEKDWNSAIKC